MTAPIDDHTAANRPPNSRATILLPGVETRVDADSGRKGEIGRFEGSSDATEERQQIVSSIHHEIVAP